MAERPKLEMNFMFCTPYIPARFISAGGETPAEVPESGPF
jgi:hypothetical protein